MLTYDFHTNRAYYAAHNAENRELAADARHGGRILTAELARFSGPAVSHTMMAEDPRHAWTYIDHPVPNPRARWQELAHEAASSGPVIGGPIDRVGLWYAEAMMDWPIYRAGVIATSSVCGLCSHRLRPYAGTGHADYPNLDGCVECDEAAQEGSYAPCVTLS